MATGETPRARTVLGEIPLRTELALEPRGVATTPRGVGGGAGGRRSALYPVLIDSPAANIPDSYLSPRMSPDEALIQQRGRRSVPVMWSPEKSFHLSPQKTPTKSISAMTLRSSPRKRCLIKELSEVNPETISGAILTPQGATAISTTAGSASKKSSSATPTKPGLSVNAKKIRIEEGSIHRQNTELSLELLLKGLSKDQLVTIIAELVNGGTVPLLEETIRNNLPVPDISPLEEELSYLKKNITKSLPTTRLLSKTDSAAYARAATHLVSFKKALIEQSQTLNSSKHWDALLDYVLMAWPHVRGIPTWDNHAHNAVRRHCFKILAYHASNALKLGSFALGEERLGKLETKLKSMAADCEDIKDCASHLSYLLETH